MSEGFQCPVCGYRDEKLPSYDDDEETWYQEICPSCGTQFGYDDATISPTQLRSRWLASGAKWWSEGRPPADFDGREQLRRAGLLD
ncbi:hypothetical protein D3876_13560 [Sphingomonas cavernae]|uniref:Uncharacterized protein n=1 Tax=Sphingomonas cavernae TaxID=2320861 RepID=A0A418WMB2_9SPHN|nr:hypothetical protein D3876_13560 [Sphingomonas cavernae]